MKVKCKECGVIMNLTKKSHADLCYECTWDDREDKVKVKDGVLIIETGDKNGKD